MKLTKSCELQVNNDVDYCRAEITTTDTTSPTAFCFDFGVDESSAGYASAVVDNKSMTSIVRDIIEETMSDDSKRKSESHERQNWKVKRKSQKESRPQQMMHCCETLAFSTQGVFNMGSIEKFKLNRQSTLPQSLPTDDILQKVQRSKRLSLRKFMFKHLTDRKDKYSYKYEEGSSHDLVTEVPLKGSSHNVLTLKGC
ncbi:hypothetical protein SARC_09028 [Sphaeroforma arctica JP610]|uniref:Uncharacterized protein n=1 Tax=Sphaeroforma arctica JP610 TaxID=667725 RepID=A0A0L0FRB9_9EUKA|nr:hypothetical protein, variant [Sphaeroforma arctica JP610]XP_014152446.1 hypothetical protein SARC_09028 [Sphaeroforma arctica JP610]KNC78543.1 hypothetical protein, variant [Sphaeroforma arctica JP610]KNC78544.1 hypothetical protein SARC_09028 [Sphaeroforma arctica JP610]|eukprot:XP_014152445.1 hypothetical protein, variant [Sphaeroforma arctica JP610]